MMMNGRSPLAVSTTLHRLCRPKSVPAMSSTADPDDFSIPDAREIPHDATPQRPFHRSDGFHPPASGALESSFLFPRLKQPT